MGCDIHAKVQVREGGVWRTIEAPVEKRGEGSLWEFEFEHWPGLGDRNYDHFAVLANVRNDGNIMPISKPKGLPKDMQTFGFDVEDYALGDHSQSWVDLLELLGYPWDREVTKTGVITFEAYKAWRVHKGQPDGWSRLVGGGVRTITSLEADQVLAAGGEQDYVQVTWTTTVREACARLIVFIEETLVPLVLKGGGLEDVRIVFGFDS